MTDSFARAEPVRSVESAQPGEDAAPVEEPAATVFSRWTRFRPLLTLDHRIVLGLVLLASVLTRIVWLTVPNTANIFDETYYINAARVLDGITLPKSNPPLPYADMPRGKDPNHEHPPLGKAMIAGSIRLFGDDPYGWRLPSILTGMLAIVLVYLIVLAGGGGAWLAVLAATLFSLDNLVLVHSRIATLDIPLVAFLLLASWCALKKWPLLAGAACGLATCVKIGGLYGLLALLLLEAVWAFWSWRDTRHLPFANLRSASLLLAGFVLVWLGGMWALDAAFTSYTSPFDHLHYIFTYGFRLTVQGQPQGIESNPWQWLLNQVPITYYRTDTVIKSGTQTLGTYPTVWFRGEMNPVIIGAASLGASFALWRAWRLRDPLSTWVVVWIAGTYLPFFPLAMGEHRVSYIFYFLPTLPAVIVGLAQLLKDGGLPRIVIWGYLVLVLVGFIGYFPFRTIV